MRNGVKIGTTRGVDIYLRPYIFLFFLAAWFVGSMDEVLLAYAALALHEAGHVVAARLMNMRISRIELAPYGGAAHIDGAFELLPSREFFIAIAGPVASICAAMITLGFSGTMQLDAAFLDTFVQSNLLIGLFNLAPALPLDGGRMLRALLTKRLGIRAATGISASTGILLGTGLVALFACGKLNGSFALVGCCILPSSIAALRSADGLLLRSITGGVHIDDLPTTVRRIAVSESAMASNVLSKLKVGDYYELLVLDEKGKLKAVLNSQTLYDAILGGADTMADAAAKLETL